MSELSHADRTRAAQLAHQTRRDRTARTSLGLAIHHLEQARKFAQIAERGEQGEVLRRLHGDAIDLYQGWPSPDRDRAAS